MKESINLYIADDHQIVIDGLSLLLKSENNIFIIGSASDGQKAYEDILLLKPDIALLDYRMPGRDGLEIVRLLLNKTKTKFIILSMHQDRRILKDAINYNVYAYLLKNIGKEELIATINKTYLGEKTISSNKNLLQSSEKTFLSPREMDVLLKIMEGLTTQKIAEILALSPLTVGTHRRNLMKKANVVNTSQLIKWATENEIID